MAKKLWTEQYRPKVVDDYVFRDEKQKQQVKSWIKDGAIPHLLLSGAAGLGKTTLAKVIFNELNVDNGDILQINGSTQNGVEFIRDKITNFVTMIPFGEYKYVLLDEGDYLSPNAQGALRNVMETYSNTVRFIITCNYPKRIMPAIHSRCQGFHVERLDKKAFAIRVAQILIEEGIEFDVDTLDVYIGATYPDMRKCINNLQMNSVDGSLKNPTKEDNQGSADYMVKAVSLFRERKYREARTVICNHATPEEYNDLFTFMYQNVELWAGDDTNKEDEAIVTIRNGMAKAPLCADQEINVSATLCELELIASS